MNFRPDTPNRLEDTMDRTTRIILPWALSLCSLSALAADPDSGQPGLRPATGVVRTFGNPLRWRLVGDHYFAPSLGLRATGGLLGPTVAGSSPDTGIRLGTTQRRATPYVGLGYSTGGVSANRWGGWGVSADIGLQASQGSEWPLGRALESPAGMGDLLRELRLTPVLQLGVSYAF
jgi:hypothetical protein